MVLSLQFLQDFTKNQETSISNHIYIIKRMTNLNYQKGEGKGTSCRPQPIMLHPLPGDSSITLLRKSPLYSLSS